MDVERSPVSDALWFIIDPNFDGQLTVPLYLRAVVTFCMFGADDVVKFAYCVVTQNTLALVERVLGTTPVPGKAGARGIDRVRNKSVYWKDAVPWQSLEDAKASSDRLSVRQFCQLLYSLHAPTSALATTVKASIGKANSIAVLGSLRLFQFRQIVTDYPTLLAPIFQLQSSMRTKLLGEEWWSSKREVFTQACVPSRASRMHRNGSTLTPNVSTLTPHATSYRNCSRTQVRDEADLLLKYKIIEKQRVADEKARVEREEAKRLARKAKAFEKAAKAAKKKRGKGGGDDDEEEEDEEVRRFASRDCAQHINLTPRSHLPLYRRAREQALAQVLVPILAAAQTRLRRARRRARSSQQRVLAVAPPRRARRTPAAAQPLIPVERPARPRQLHN